MSKAQERALEAYPVYMVRRRYDGIARSDDQYDSNLRNRFVFKEGYEQAENTDAIKKATWDLIDAVERYVRQDCLRSELLSRKDNLKKLLEK